MPLATFCHFARPIASNLRTMEVSNAHRMSQVAEVPPAKSRARPAVDACLHRLELLWICATPTSGYQSDLRHPADYGHIGAGPIAGALKTRVMDKWGVEKFRSGRKFSRRWQDITFTYFGMKNQKFDCAAVCQTEGGPEPRGRFGVSFAYPAMS